MPAVLVGTSEDTHVAAHTCTWTEVVRYSKPVDGVVVWMVVQRCVLCQSRRVVPAQAEALAQA